MTKKVFCVFEESHHEDAYEQDLDGLYLLDIYDTESEAVKAMKNEFRKITRDGDDVEMLENEISLTRFTQVVVPGKPVSYDLDVTWKWFVEERIVRRRFDEHLHFSVRSTGEDIDGECEVFDIRTGGNVNLGKFPTRKAAEKFVLSQPDEDE